MKLSYYLNISDFIKNLVKVNTSPFSPTVTSTILYGKTKLYNSNNNKAVGTCFANFQCIGTGGKDIFTNIDNAISTDSGLILTWVTPTSLANLALDTIINGMVTECIVKCTTKIGASAFYGKTFNMVVSSKSGKIFFDLQEI
jgi:hypothetical protein